MELSIVLFVNQISLPYLDVFTAFISNEVLLSLLFLLSVLGVYLSSRENWFLIISSAIFALLLHFFITKFLIKDVLSDIMFRSRPYTIEPLIHQIGTSHIDSSFPSSHMSGIVSVVTVYFFFYQRYWCLMLTFILLIAFARIHNGMHYASDVVAGSILGSLYGVISIYVVRKIYRS